MKHVTIKEKYAIVGSDFSQQEPRLTTAMSGCQEWIDAYSKGLDLYATIGTGAFNNTYWENMEHHEDGTPNVDGKNRRKKCKTLLLGITYGMGVKMIAERMGVTADEANKIFNDFYNNFPQIKEWMAENENKARQQGYIEDYWGRRRRLPDAQLPEYEFTSIKTSNKFNPLLFSTPELLAVPEETKQALLLKLQKCRSKKERDTIYLEAEQKLGIKIRNNGGFISRAMRQATNASIQGSAATMTKKAMINIANDQQMKDYDFKMLIGVHDELIGECKLEFAKECCERLALLMRTCVPEVPVPFKCDGELEGEDCDLIEKGIKSKWYLNTFAHTICDEYEKLLKNEPDKNKAMDIMYKNHCELTQFELQAILSDTINT